MGLVCDCVCVCDYSECVVVVVDVVVWPKVGFVQIMQIGYGVYVM